MCTLSWAVHFEFCQLLSIINYLESAKVNLSPRSRSELNHTWQWVGMRQVEASKPHLPPWVPPGNIYWPWAPPDPPPSLLSPCSGPRIIILCSLKKGKEGTKGILRAETPDLLDLGWRHLRRPMDAWEPGQLWYVLQGLWSASGWSSFWLQESLCPTLVTETSKI